MSLPSTSCRAACSTPCGHNQGLPLTPGFRSLSALEQILGLLRNQTRHDFSQYKPNTLYRRIERRMGIHQIERVADYAQYLRVNPQETELLFRELLIGVTRFFRDAAAWDSLKTQALPALFASLGHRSHLRAWVAACSSGEEAYSLAIVFQEALEAFKPQRPLAQQIYATDLDAQAIAIPRRGVYPLAIANDVSPDRLERYFVPQENGYRIGQAIRDRVIFAPQNLIADPPFTKLDLLCCRNLLIYLTPALQKKLIPLFHYSLNPGGLLFLGSAESIGAESALFTPVDTQARLFRRNPGALPLASVEFPGSERGRLTGGDEDLPGPRAVRNLQADIEQLLLQRFAPAAVLTNAQGDILYIHGRTGPFLEPASGKANWNIHAMVRGGLRGALATAFQQAVRQPGLEVVRPVMRSEEDGGTPPLPLRLGVTALEEPESLRGQVLSVFEVLPAATPAVPARRRPGRGITREAALEEEVARLQAALKIAAEAQQAAHEELQSYNEELQSTNEELQSTNEELTTSKEELQSLNEELQTVNAELQAKVDDLSRASNDMDNLMNSTEIATVFLDNTLGVRRYTPAATRVIKLIPSDVGRPLSDLRTELSYPDMFPDAREVLRTLAFSERDVEARDGRWFKVRIMPYRTTDNVIDGLVITFLEITVAKRLEARLREAGGEPGAA